MKHFDNFFSGLVIILSFAFGFISVALGQENDEKEFGWLQPRINLEEFYVVVDGNLQEATLMNPGDSLRVEAGKHTFRIVGEFIYDYVTEKVILPNEVKVLYISFGTFSRHVETSFYIIEQQQNIAIQADEKSKIYINDEFVGEGAAGLLLPAGKHKMHIVHPEYGDLTKTIEAGYTRINRIARYNENPGNLSFAEMLLPGAGYVSTNQKTKAIATYSAIGASALLWAITNSLYNDKKSLFNQATLDYRNAVTTQSAIAFREKASSIHDDMVKLNNRLTALSLAALGIYVVSTIDGFRKPRQGYKGPFRSDNFSVRISTMPDNPGGLPVAILRLNLN